MVALGIAVVAWDVLYKLAMAKNWKQFKLVTSLNPTGGSLVV